MFSRLVPALAASLVLSAPVAAQIAPDAPKADLIHPLFQDHGVLQRNQPIPVWGWVAPKQAVTVTFLGQTYKARADKTGAWQVKLGPAPAGGPYDLQVAAQGGETRTIRDILLGDVFLCSGQSNMQFRVDQSRNDGAEIAVSANDRIRLLSMERRSMPAPLMVPPSQIKWVAAGPKTVPEFSAVCYFFGREIEKTRGVPVGLIHSSWGGTPIQEWTPAEGLKAVGGFYQSLDKLALFARDEKAALKDLETGTRAWEAANDPGTRATPPWSDSALNDSEWAKASLPRIWEDTGQADLKELDGVVWFRKHFTLTAEEVTKGGTLNLGPVDERDLTFVNGVKVGETADHRVDRAYAVAASILKAGDNVIAVRAIDEGGGGGLKALPERLVFQVTGGEAKPLAGPWAYKIAGDFNKGFPKPPFVPWMGGKGHTTLYNAMIAPLAPYGLKGVLWYQGEQNAGESELYSRLLPEMIRNWRVKFQPDLPFLIVQLAGYGPLMSAPAENGFANIREVQRLTAQSVPHTGLAVTIDLGHPRDVHPTDKQEVGRRLSFEAARVIYGDANASVSALPVKALRKDGSVWLTFNRPEGLTAYGTDQVLGFELCTASNTCRYAPAQLEGGQVRISDVAPDARKLRYGWAGSPVLNLMGRDGLPPSPFEISIILEKQK